MYQHGVACVEKLFVRKRYKAVTKSQSKLFGLFSNATLVPCHEITHWATRGYIEYVKSLFAQLLAACRFSGNQSLSVT